MKTYRFFVDIEAENEEEAKEEFSEVFNYDFKNDSQWLEVDIRELKK